MSEINLARVWYPPAFPEQGRLPVLPVAVGQNCHIQNSEERAYYNELCLAANRPAAKPYV